MNNVKQANDQIYEEFYSFYLQYENFFGNKLIKSLERELNAPVEYVNRKRGDVLANARKFSDDATNKNKLVTLDELKKFL
jgi:hypothetical protein